MALKGGAAFALLCLFAPLWWKLPSRLQFTTHGWQSLVLSTFAAVVVASAIRDARAGSARNHRGRRRPNIHFACLASTVAITVTGTVPDAGCWDNRMEAALVSSNKIRIVRKVLSRFISSPRTTTYCGCTGELHRLAKGAAWRKLAPHAEYVSWLAVELRLKFGMAPLCQAAGLQISGGRCSRALGMKP
jgi:hypothetical protein